MADDGLVLWYAWLAQEWVEALPIGAGRLGAMVLGGAGTERLHFNDDTLWSGVPREWRTRCDRQPRAQ